MAYTEANYENAVLEIFRDTLGYGYLHGPDVNRDYDEPLYMDELLPALRRINPGLPEEAITEAVKKLQDIEGGTILQRNVQFMRYIQDGITVNYLDNHEQRSTLVSLVDYEQPDHNTFTVANQWTIVERSKKRPDIIVFLNGMPVVVFELKSPSREQTDASEAFLQLRNYMSEIPSLFTYNAFCAISDLAISKAGIVTADENRFMEWKTKDGQYENTQYAQFDTFIEGMFDKARLLDIIKNFICFSTRTSGQRSNQDLGEKPVNAIESKVLAAYHQYFAVKKAIASTVKATETDGRGGVFWHTQGSGKSLSMVFYARLLQEALESPTIIVLTDRNDLDNQLFSEFAKYAAFLRQSPRQAKSREDLKNKLIEQQVNGIIFTTMQKFEESSEPISTRRNIVVMADEAHRGQYGLAEKVDAKTGRVTVGIARIIRDTLPNATYIGFTGTPISSKDRSTIEVFGNYIDIYDMTQAVEDGATRPVYYESRVIRLKLDEEILRLIDEEYDIMAAKAEPYAIEKSKKQLSRMENILGAEQTVTALCEDIIEHYEENRQHELTGKAMIVAYSRPIAMRIYHKLLEIRPEWAQKVGVVMTASNDDPEEWHELIGNKRHRDEMATKFKNDDDPLKIAIVVDMWLTGFDLPSLATMYVYKPMTGHNLMQAIARVNRVYKDKTGGLVVDYVGIIGALKKAMNDYTNRDKQNYGEQDIAKTAFPKFIEKLEVCRDLLHGYDYSEFMSKRATDLTRATTVVGGANFLIGVESTATTDTDGAAEGAVARDNRGRTRSGITKASVGYGNTTSRKEAFIREATLLRQALSLCRSLLNSDQRLEAAYIDAVRTLLTRITGEDKQLSLNEINAQINELLKASIKSEGVINLFSDVDTGFSLFDPKFIEQISKMKEKNLAVEILRKLLVEQVSIYRRTNLVKSEKFSEMLSRIMNAYTNGAIQNEETIRRLQEMAFAIQTAEAEGEKLGLSKEEKAFYDALVSPLVIKDLEYDQNLIALTHELTDKLRRSRTIDWQKKESARAGMRRLVKQLLKKYAYPPEGMEYATDTVIRQCELFVDNSSGG